MTSTTVGIDQSYSGLAMTLLRGDDTHDTLLGKFSSDKYGTGVNRLLVIDDWLITNLYGWADAGEKITHVCMEGYSASSKFGREKAGELGATVKRAVYEVFSDDVKALTCYPTIVAPTALKKFVTGSGAAGKKNLMLLATYRKWGVEFDDDNKADSTP